MKAILHQISHMLIKMHLISQSTIGIHLADHCQLLSSFGYVLCLLDNNANGTEFIHLKNKTVFEIQQNSQKHKKVHHSYHLQHI